MQAIDGGCYRMLQTLTPEQLKVFSSGAEEVAKWAAGAIMLAGMKALHRSIKSIRPGIVSEVSNKVSIDLDAKLGAQTADLDRKMAAQADVVARSAESLESKLSDHAKTLDNHAESDIQNFKRMEVIQDSIQKKLADIQHGLNNIRQIRQPAHGD